MYQLDRIATAVFNLFRVCGGERTGGALAQVLGMTPSSLAPSLEQWVQEGWLAHLPARPGHYRLVPETAQGLVPDPQWREDSRELTGILVDLEEGRILSACEKFLCSLDAMLKRSQVNGAVLSFELLLQKLKAVSVTLDAQDIQRFISFVLSASDLAMYLTKFHRETILLCINAREMAYASGNTRDAVLLHLVESCLENMGAECSVSRMLELHGKCELVLKMHGNDILDVHILSFIGMFHFWHGHFQKVLQAFEDAQHKSQLWKSRFQKEMFPLYTSSSVLYLGRTHQAVGILDAARREAVLDQDRFKTMWWEAQLGMVLLYMGHLEDALELFDPVIARADPEVETKILHWGMRGVAAYHFMRGNIQNSHTVMREAMRISRKNGFRRPIFSYPWMYDMLYSYEKAGLPSIEGLDLEDELQRALEGYNVHLRASALRTQARRRLDAGAAHTEVASLLQQSLNDFIISENPLEISRTRQWLNELLNSTHPAGTNTHEPDDVETNCRLALNTIRTIPDTQQRISQILYIASCELGAERAALFQVDDMNILHGEASCNMSDVELATGQLASSLSGMQPALGSKPLLLDDAGVVILILPLLVEGEQPRLLYLESRYAVQTLRSISLSTQSVLLRLFSEELRDALKGRHAKRSNVELSQKLTQATSYSETPESMFYGSPMTRRVLSHARQLATTDAPVLILGETGVGKELLARYVHECSGRRGPFVPVHPASIPEGLFESEFFGHEKGAFTGAHKQKIGLAEMAHEGTLFIDEVGDIPMPVQVKLLRVFQNRCFSRLGSTGEIRSEFRLVGATNKDLWQEVQEGRFRKDLYYRIAVVPLTLPPLRKRPEDIQVLVKMFLDHYARRYHRVVQPPSEHDMTELMNYDWPGNVRELKSVIERAVILHQGGQISLALSGLPSVELSSPQRTAETPVPAADIIADLPTVDTLLSRYIRHVLELTNGRVTGPRGALRILGMKRSTLYARMKQYGIPSSAAANGTYSIAEERK